MINVEVCYALPEKQWLLSIRLPKGSTVIEAIMRSGLLDQFPDINLVNNVGIFGKKVSLNALIQEGDRIEIYRPLALTPNQLRLKRANKL
jgi:putative ubiquitin-RnfH superfamily antitoxin RatB of RatAB toxin-antitoxin module